MCGVVEQRLGTARSGRLVRWRGRRACRLALSSARTRRDQGAGGEAHSKLPDSLSKTAGVDANTRGKDTEKHESGVTDREPRLALACAACATSRRDLGARLDEARLAEPRRDARRKNGLQGGAEGRMEGT